ncbi:ABC-type transport auxiliary lipoprotein family protein [Aquabacter spiritensis]|uniref:ABC-type transport auxiliary lipoprotein family protein n=1 Tax=Aquabacter spiritensis TaxID=933073 RepID=UPI001FE17EB4|nr:ABC-type transport auxiliary lipoprotein family protein [Aquabacter spiritensis]
MRRLNPLRPSLRVGVAGLCLLLAGCGTAPVPTFDLSAPTAFSARGGGGQLVVVTPTALAALDTQQILVEPAPGQVTYLPEAQWSDRLPALLQARLIEAFENGSKIRRVARPNDGVAADYQLNVDIRTFGVQIAAGAPDAVVSLSVKVIATASGHIVAAQVFSARVPVSAMNGAGVTAALDAASDTVLRDIVIWASARS